MSRFVVGVLVGSVVTVLVLTFLLIAENRAAS